MDDGEFHGSTASPAIEEEVFALAAAALSVLASRGKQMRAEPVDWATELCQACIHASEDRRHAAISRLIASGITSEEIVDTYVPRAALKLGEGWVDDTLSFAEVSIGAARLQETVRAFSRRRNGGTAVIPLGHRVLVVIPQEEEHTLGAFIAASQFRRYGVWVHLAIGQNADEIAETLRCQSFDMIGFSGSGRRSLASMRQIVDKVRRSVPAAPPIVAGGNICNLGLDLCEYTGVDLATTSPRKAMEFSGMPIAAPRHDIAECTIPWKEVGHGAT